MAKGTSMTRIRAIVVAALLALLTPPSLAQAEDWTEYCYTEYRFIGWLLVQRHVCVTYSNGSFHGPWVQYQF